MQNQQTTQELRTYTDEIFSQQQIISNINRRDLRLIASNMDEDQARFYVTRYYILQNDRIRYNNQVRTLGAKPNLLLSAFSEVTARQEKLLKNVLDDHTIDHPVGSWLRSIRGIGPVIAAGLVSHIDPARIHTAGSIWRFAGLDPTQAKMERGVKRTWNADLKKLVFLAGESFVKTKGHEEGFYGHLYEKKKEYYTRKNLAGEFSEVAARILTEKKWDPTTVTYAALKTGKLSAGHIHAMARRFAVKVFLSHLFEVYCITVKGIKPPAPFALAILGHAHRLEIPNPGSIRAFADPIGDDLVAEDLEESESHDDDMAGLLNKKK